MKKLDPTKWDDILSRPDWYRLLWPEIRAWRAEVEALKPRDRAASRKLKDLVQSYFEDKLRARQVACGTSGENLDAARRPVMQIVIHHTGRDPGVSLERLNAIQLLNLYVPEFVREDRHTPIWSNHVRDGAVVFWAYHWLVREDGTAERLLRDSEIGWQAGNWEVNCRSVGICLDGDFRESEPGEAAVSGAREIITSLYPHVAPAQIMGHRAINLMTTCPGTRFETWKQGLIPA